MSKIDPILKETYMQKTMNEYRKEALRKISTVVAHLDLIGDLSLLMAHGWLDSQPSAESLADKLDLCKIDFLAILEDIEGFEELLMIEREVLFG